MLLVCMLLGLTTQYWICCALSTISQYSLVAYSSLDMLEASWIFPVHFGMSNSVVFVQLIFGQLRW